MHKIDFLLQLFSISNLTLYSCDPEPINCHIPTSAPAITFCVFNSIFTFQAQYIAYLSSQFISVYCFGVMDVPKWFPWLGWDELGPLSPKQMKAGILAVFVYKCFLPAEGEKVVMWYVAAIIILFLKYHIVHHIIWDPQTRNGGWVGAWHNTPGIPKYKDPL